MHKTGNLTPILCMFLSSKLFACKWIIGNEYSELLYFLNFKSSPITYGALLEWLSMKSKPLSLIYIVICFCE